MQKRKRDTKIKTKLRPLTSCPSGTAATNSRRYAAHASIPPPYRAPSGRSATPDTPSPLVRGPAAGGDTDSDGEDICSSKLWSPRPPARGPAGGCTGEPSGVPRPDSGLSDHTTSPGEAGGGDAGAGVAMEAAREARSSARVRPPRAPGMARGGVHGGSPPTPSASATAPSALEVGGDSAPTSSQRRCMVRPSKRRTCAWRHPSRYRSPRVSMR
mmetsp:Transcript_29078/g.92807  ORF Transcript_29078/g.92807 Transcript_29078/m.92807 type:complete len:214 (+) Transcript_29078:259-900(+)